MSGTSFTKRSSRGGPPVIRGCYPTAQFHLCTTFASCPNLDSLVFGGGVPVGAVLAVADVNPKSGRADSTRTSKYARSDLPSPKRIAGSRNLYLFF